MDQIRAAPSFPSTPPVMPAAATSAPGRRLPGVLAPEGVNPIGWNDPGSFAWSVFHERHRPLLAQVQANSIYDPSQRRALASLLTESTEDVMAPLSPDAHDQAAWSSWGADHFERPWSEAPFLFAESYFYRRLLDAVDFFVPGPGFWLDPFAPRKSAELAAMTVDHPPHDLADLLLASTVGNQADLAFRSAPTTPTTGSAGAADHPNLIVDDRATVAAHLNNVAVEDRRIAVVADNAGEELVSDLHLIDHLLVTGIAEQVELHLKAVPYYVSDAVPTDVQAALQVLATAPATSAMAERLSGAVAAARLRLTTHWFYTSPLSYHHLPHDLVERFASHTLVVFKGDLNYRRLVGDYTWPATTPFADAVGYLACNVVALRTLKSDVVVGLTPQTERTLDQFGAPWRTGGTHALIQANLNPEPT